VTVIGGARTARRDRRQFARRAPCTGPATAAWVLGVLVCWMAAPVSTAAPAAILGLLALAVVDGLWSFFALGQVEMTVRTPTDLTVDEPALMEVTVDRPRTPVLVRMISAPRGTSGYAAGGRRVVLRAVPHRRGVFEAAEFELRITAPLGIVGGRRYVLVPFPVPVAIGPAPLEVHVPDVRTEARDGSSWTEPVREGELTRGARPYAPGDGVRRVHWPATARSGELMVREGEQPHEEVAVLVVDLGPEPGPDAERVAGMGRGAVDALLSRGHRVALVTHERGGVVHELVADAMEAGRRLASAVPGPPIERAEEWLAVEP
jgi:uncharacterized protein (DUF58 family)